MRTPSDPFRREGPFIVRKSLVENETEKDKIMMTVFLSRIVLLDKLAKEIKEESPDREETRENRSVQMYLDLAKELLKAYCKMGETKSGMVVLSLRSELEPLNKVKAKSAINNFNIQTSHLTSEL